ncbi:MAG: lasso peptide biosynthesis B2 protein [Chloroflexales bacterium]|nr:lasso peptide biosynthesis B2 protein [Chloroflexales bacterium]
MSNLLKFFTIPAHERRLVLAALPIIVVARLGIWLIPLPDLQRLLAWLADATATTPAHGDYAGRAARAVRRASRVVPGATCLTQALATMTLMRRRGLVGRLCLSAHPTHVGRSYAQAWVEFGGRVIIGATTASLALLTPMPAFKGETS